MATSLLRGCRRDMTVGNGGLCIDADVSIASEGMSLRAAVVLVGQPVDEGGISHDRNCYEVGHTRVIFRFAWTYRSSESKGSGYLEGDCLLGTL